VLFRSLAQYFRANNIEHRIFSQSELDYTDPDKLREFIEENDRNIRTVINCSGYTGVPNVDACEDNKELCYNYNVLYPLNVVKICNAFRFLLFISVQGAFTPDMIRSILKMIHLTLECFQTSPLTTQNVSMCLRPLLRTINATF